MRENLAATLAATFGHEGGLSMDRKDGNHIFVATDVCVFDYHGYSGRGRFLTHTYRRARLWWPGWRATLVELPRDVLVSEAASRRYDGLWLREPTQFLYNAMPRAHAYLDRFSHPCLKST